MSRQKTDFDIWNEKHQFNNKCIDCNSKNIAQHGITSVLSRPVYVCDDCLTVFSVEGNKWIHAKKTVKLDGMIVIA